MNSGFRLSKITKHSFLLLYNKDDKRRIYWLIDSYLANKINESVFCDEFHCSYDLEIDCDTLTDYEYKAFSQLGKIAGRFSEFEEAYKECPGVFHTKEELRKKILETKEKLNFQNYELLGLELPNPSITETAQIGDEEWLICPNCIDAWLCNDHRHALVRCPKCQKDYNNPRYKNEKFNGKF